MPRKVLFSTVMIASILAGCQSPNTQQRVASVVASPPMPGGLGPNGKKLYYYYFVFSNATPGKDAEFNRWYDRIHAPLVIEGGDFVWAQRFELAPDGEGFAGGGTPELKTRRYLVIFAAESDNIRATLADADTRLATPRNVDSPAFDRSSLQSSSWRALGPPITQKDAIRLLAEETAAGNLPKPGEVPPGWKPYARPSASPAPQTATNPE